jgi:hypothetical protein
MAGRLSLKRLGGLISLGIATGFTGQAAAQDNTLGVSSNTLGNVTSTGGVSSTQANPSQQFVTTNDSAITLTGPCDGTAHILAVTNRVPTTIESPRNVGDCSFELQCRQGGSPTSPGALVGFRVTFPQLARAHSFSCGANADSIRIAPQVMGGTAAIEYVP